MSKINPSKLDVALNIIDDNYIMFNSCLSSNELKKFNGDFSGYLIRQLNIRKRECEKIDKQQK